MAGLFFVCRAFRCELGSATAHLPRLPPMAASGRRHKKLRIAPRSGSDAPQFSKR